MLITPHPILSIQLILILPISYQNTTSLWSDTILGIKSAYPQPLSFPTNQLLLLVDHKFAISQKRIVSFATWQFFTGIRTFCHLDNSLEGADGERGASVDANVRECDGGKK